MADSAYSLSWKNSHNTNGGAHGYDPANTNMHGIFIASGPAFKEAYLQPTFENIQLYNVFAKVLGLKPAANDGKLSEVQNMLKGNK